MPHSLTAFYNPEISQTRREVGYEKFPQILQTLRYQDFLSYRRCQKCKQQYQCLIRIDCSFAVRVFHAFTPNLFLRNSSFRVYEVNTLKVR